MNQGYALHVSSWMDPHFTQRAYTVFLNWSRILLPTYLCLFIPAYSVIHLLIILSLSYCCVNFSVNYCSQGFLRTSLSDFAFFYQKLQKQLPAHSLSNLTFDNCHGTWMKCPVWKDSISSLDVKPLRLLKWQHSIIHYSLCFYCT